jgi:hypothetical protein
MVEGTIRLERDYHLREASPTGIIADETFLFLSTIN